MGSSMDVTRSADGVAPRRSEERLLLDEANHRVANEVAAALAAMRLIKPARGTRSRWRLLHQAVDRLEGFGEVHRLLSGRVAPVVDAAVDLESLCRSLAGSRAVSGRSSVTLRLDQVWIDGETARRLLLIANELITNAIRHAMVARDGRLHLGLSGLDGRVVLTVGDDGPGMAAASPAAGTGLGGAIVSELVRRGGGWIECDTGPQGTTFHVMLPFDPAAVARTRGRG